MWTWTAGREHDRRSPVSLSPVAFREGGSPTRGLSRHSFSDGGSHLQKPSLAFSVIGLSFCVSPGTGTNEKVVPIFDHRLSYRGTNYDLLCLHTPKPIIRSLLLWPDQKPGTAASSTQRSHMPGQCHNQAFHRPMAAGMKRRTLHPQCGDETGTPHKGSGSETVS